MGWHSEIRPSALQPSELAKMDESLLRLTPLSRVAGRERAKVRNHGLLPNSSRDGRCWRESGLITALFLEVKRQRVR